MAMKGVSPSKELNPVFVRSDVNSRRSENGGCLAEDRLESLLGDQRGKVQVTALTSMLHAIAKRIKWMMAHEGASLLGVFGRIET